MTRVHPVTEENASPKVKFIYDLLQKKLGRVPNIFLNMGNAPAVLEGYLALSDAANHTSLSPKIREQIALVVGQTNDCRYCLSAHSAIAGSLGLKQEDILSARRGLSSDPKDHAILQFAKKLVENKGHMKDAEIVALKKSGVDDEEMLEIVMLVSLNIFTNYFNHLTDPSIDFPSVPQSI